MLLYDVTVFGSRLVVLSWIIAGQFLFLHVSLDVR